MKKILVAVAMLGFIHVAAQDLSLYQKRLYITAKGDTLPYRILFPENYDRTKKYPLVLFLHGAGERGNDNEKQLTHGAKLFLSPEARKDFPAIVIFPPCKAEGFWGNVNIYRTKTPLIFDFDYTRPATDQLEIVITWLKKIIKEENGDKNRLYVIRISMGV